MKNQKYFILYLIAILSVLLLVLLFGYYNYKNTSFTGISKDTSYSVGRRIKYANLSWYVLKDDGNYVTLILSKNATLNKYGSTTDFDESYAKDYLNDEWIFIGENKTLKDEISHGALVKDSETGTYLRLVKADELANIKIENDSDTPYWTMSSEDGKLIYVLENGDMSYTTYTEEDSKTGKCYLGENELSISNLTKYNKTVVLNTTNTVSDPSSTKVVVSESTEKVTETCYTDYKITNGEFFTSGNETSYISSWKITNNTESIGIRPVIVVKKK